MSKLAACQLDSQVMRSAVLAAIHSARVELLQGHQILVLIHFLNTRHAMTSSAIGGRNLAHNETGQFEHSNYPQPYTLKHHHHSI
jgi:hypothetical protein